MSLDVDLIIEGATSSARIGSGIFIRENGQTKEITREEWDKLYPGREPHIVWASDDDGTVYSANITHNLARMADEAELHKPMWRPREVGIETAAQLIEPLKAGLALLESDPERFKQFNPKNGWGDYEGLVEFVRKYLEACEQYPAATVWASR